MKISRISILLVACLVASCGKYGPPLTPEALAPKPVSGLTPAGTQAGVTLSWDAPDSDARGKALKDLDGYRVYRKVITRPSDVLDKEVEYVLIGTVLDSHVAKLEALRAEARAAGRSTRGISVDDGQTHFTFTDDKVNPGAKYLYKVLPFNQGGVEGDAGKYAQVMFRGDSTEARVFEMGGLQDTGLD